MRVLLHRQNFDFLQKRQRLTAKKNFITLNCKLKTNKRFTIFMNQQKLRRTVFVALFAAIICVACVLAIPLPGGVPISLQNFFCILAGALLGSFRGVAAVLVWILLGAVGVPVFANAHGGLGVLLGPTGGYIVGYALGALFVGLLLGSPKIDEKSKGIKRWILIFFACFFGYVLVYVPGIPRFMAVMAANGKPQTFQNALSLTFIPFIPGDLIKFFITVSLGIALRPVVARYFFNDDDEKSALEELNRLNENSKNE